MLGLFRKMVSWYCSYIKYTNTPSRAIVITNFPHSPSIHHPFSILCKLWNMCLIKVLVKMSAILFGESTHLMVIYHHLHMIWSTSIWALCHWLYLECLDTGKGLYKYMTKYESIDYENLYQIFHRLKITWA